MCAQVVYLNALTHVEGPSTTALHQELDAALTAGKHIILVHKARPDAHGTTFKAIIDATPPMLAWNATTGKKRLYQARAGRGAP